MGVCGARAYRQTAATRLHHDRFLDCASFYWRIDRPHIIAARNGRNSVRSCVDDSCWDCGRHVHYPPAPRLERERMVGSVEYTDAPDESEGNQESSSTRHGYGPCPALLYCVPHLCIDTYFCARHVGG